MSVSWPIAKALFANDDAELAKRRKAMEKKGTDAWKPTGRKREVTAALKPYAALATSAAKGAVRDVGQVE